MSQASGSQGLFRCLAIASPSFAKNPELVKQANLIAKDVILNTTGERLGEDGLIDFLTSTKADAVIIGTDTFSARVAENAPQLRAVGKYGVGLDRVDVKAMEARGIYFGYTPGVNRRCVSELTLGFMLGHQRNIFKSIHRMQKNQWQKDGGTQLSGKTIGIVGFGFIGTDLASLLRPFGCNIVTHDILDKSVEVKQFGARQVTYHELLKVSDVISFHVPGGPNTHNMFGEREIALTRPATLVINTARGSVVDFAATSKAVLEFRLGGYASDVFPEEPFLSEKYQIDDGFYFTPHIGGNASEAVLAMGLAAIESLRHFLELSTSPKK